MSAPNFTAIKRWFEENRPDVPQYQLDRIMQEDAYALLMAGAFEAGREFQGRNPDCGKFYEPGEVYK